MLLERNVVAESLFHLESFVLLPVELIINLHRDALQCTERDLVNKRMWHVQNWWPEIHTRILRLYERAC